MSSAQRKICVVTGSRAEYGLLRPLLRRLQACNTVALQLVVTGSHLSAAYGHTVDEIIADGFSVDARVDLALGDDSPAGIAAASGRALTGCGAAFARLTPDLVVVLGDRYEIFAAAAAALIAAIPIAHLHGGELTEGAIDDALRHAITKLSHLHFVAASEYRERVLQLGEAPAQVFLTGGLGIDCIRELPLLARKDLEATLDFRFGPRNLLVTFHPVTLEPAESQAQLRELLTALASLQDTHLIFTLANADAGGRILNAMIEAFVQQHPHAKCFASLGQLRYFSCIAQVDGVVGNSSSGLLEVPSLHKGTINIGDRQHGRLRAASIIDCATEAGAIKKALQRLYEPDFIAMLPTVSNPYGEGGAAEKIAAILTTVELAGLTRKQFHDRPRANSSELPPT